MGPAQLAGKFEIATAVDHPRNSRDFEETEMAKVVRVNIEEAVRSHYRKVYHFSLHLTRNPDDAADLTQHAYEMLAQNAHKISDPGNVKSWLHTTVYRKFVDQHRRTKRFPSVELKDEHLEEAGKHSVNDLQIDAQVALKALHQLDDDLRAPLALFYLEDYSYKEIAGTLGLPVGTVMSRLYRGKQHLYQSLTGTIAS